MVASPTHLQICNHNRFSTWFILDKNSKGFCVIMSIIQSSPATIRSEVSLGTKQRSLHSDPIHHSDVTLAQHILLITRPYFGPRSMPQQIILKWNICSLNSALFRNGSVLKGQCNQITQKDFSLRSSVSSDSQGVTSTNFLSFWPPHSGAERNFTWCTAVFKNSDLSLKNSVPITPKSTDLSVNLHQKGLFLQ